MFRQLPKLRFERERLELADGDFMDLDWSRRGSRKLLIVLAGLEGKSNSLYSRAVISYFNERGWDCLGPNYRGCSGEPNRLLRGYHMGVSDDVATVVEHALATGDYDTVAIAGYSLGGNLALKYLGERAGELPGELLGIVSFSAPMDFEASCTRLSQWYNYHFLKYFMFPLNFKAWKKGRQFPGQVKYRRWFVAGDFLEFDRDFTAPTNGFPDVETYYRQSSCLRVLDQIRTPALVVAAEDDTFISKNCYPYESARDHEWITLEVSEYGGHCGFIRRFFEKTYWMEERAFEFLEGLLPKKSAINLETSGRKQTSK